MMKAYITIATALIVVGLFFFNVNPNELNLRGKNNSVPEFDMYVFSLQWGKTICLQDSSCTTKLINLQNKNILLMKAMMPWLSTKKGGVVRKCNQETDILIVGSDEIFNSAKQYWPSLENKGNEDYWSILYNYYGYCYTNKTNQNEYKYYFKKALEEYKNKTMSTLISNITNNATETVYVSLDELNNTLYSVLGGNYFSLKCKSIKKKQYLEEIRLALDLDFNYKEMEEQFKDKSCKSNKNITIPIIE